MEVKNTEDPKSLSSEEENIIPASSSVIPAKAGIQFPVVLLILLSTVVVLILGIFLGKTFFSSAKENSVISSTPMVAVVPTTTVATSGAEMVNWKTYTNEKGKYLIKYPNNWTIVDFKREDSDFISSVSIQEKGLPSITISVFGKDSQMAKSITRGGISYSIDGQKGERSVNEVPADVIHNVITVENKTMLYSIDISYSKKVGGEEIKLFDQILSTFKFTEK